jgi:hypothetical protein
VKRDIREYVARFLSFSGDGSEGLSAVEKFSDREWTHVLQWLYDSGLAFYFLQKLKDTKATGAVPALVLSRLERSFAANQARVEDMSRQFGSLNGRFDDLGIRFVVLKGFSLIPKFCAYAPLRHQGDFDYLVDGESLAAASRVLSDAGYVAKESRSSEEFIFVHPAGKPSRGAEQYLPSAPHAVELHVDLWDSRLHRVPGVPNLFSVERAETRHWNGLRFPALSDEDAFLLQVVHACHHLFTLWIRMSCLLEIAYFLNRRAGDGDLWNRIESRVGDSVVLREFVVIVSEMAARLFAAPLPPLVQIWGKSLRPASRIWIEHYSRRWLFSELPVYQFRLFPRSKLAVFLRQQYQDASVARESQEPKQVASSSRLARIGSSIRKEPSVVLKAGWWKRQLLFRRTVFHALAGVRYVCEIPRWQWLNRASVRPVAAVDGQVRGGSLDSDFRATS